MGPIVARSAGWTLLAQWDLLRPEGRLDLLVQWGLLRPLDLVAQWGLLRRPAGPFGPMGPVAPVAPVGPCGPMGPVAPVAPVGPIGPGGPGGKLPTSALPSWPVAGSTSIAWFGAAGFIAVIPARNIPA